MSNFSDISKTATDTACTKWDLSTQTPHGGQEWASIGNFVEDFSVTTNYMGVPKKALKKCEENICFINHYPPSDYQPALDLLCFFLLNENINNTSKNIEDEEKEKNEEKIKKNKEKDEKNKEEKEKNKEEKEEKNKEEKEKISVDKECNNHCYNNNNTTTEEIKIEKNNENKKHINFFNENKYIYNNIYNDNNIYNNEEKKKKFVALKNKILLGNGASELIDLAIRYSKAQSYRIGPFQPQYKEYERCAENENKKFCHQFDKQAKLLCIVNPCNPTGEFMNIEEMKEYIIKNVDEETDIIVDESMLPWYGPNWSTQSLISQSEWIENLAEKKNIKIFVINSWTKLWSCPGLRVGSLVAPTKKDADALKKKQTPWSMNTLGIIFLSEVVFDINYLEKTWKFTKIYRNFIVDRLKNVHPDWNIYGADWLSFIWVDTKDENKAEFYVKKCRELGVPIRWGKYGYNFNTYIRLAVRMPQHAEVLLKALEVPYQ